MTINRKAVFDIVRKGVGPLNDEMVRLTDTALTAVEHLDEERDRDVAEDAGVMTMSNEGLVFLANKEACVLSTYTDSVGVLTIGVGHTKHAGPPTPVKGTKIVMEAAFALFKKDIQKYEAGVRRAVKVPVLQHEFDAMCSFHYNTGAISRASFVDDLNKGDRKKAAQGMLKWNKPPEIKARRAAEKKLFETGNYGDISKITVYNTWPGKARRVDSSELLNPAVKVAVTLVPVEDEVEEEA